jgi:hypothetical protein
LVKKSLKVELKTAKKIDFRKGYQYYCNTVAKMKREAEQGPHGFQLSGALEMPKTAAEQIAEKIVAEAKRLCPPAMIRVSNEAYGDHGADIYIYCPRKYTDMINQRLKGTKVEALKGTRQEAEKIRIFVDAQETMSEKAKAYFANQATVAK